jgi:hypothetical protein
MRLPRRESYPCSRARRSTRCSRLLACPGAPPHTHETGQDEPGGRADSGVRGPLRRRGAPFLLCGKFARRLLACALRLIHRLEDGPRADGSAVDERPIPDALSRLVRVHLERVTAQRSCGLVWHRVPLDPVDVRCGRHARDRDRSSEARHRMAAVPVSPGVRIEGFAVGRSREASPFPRHYHRRPPGTATDGPKQAEIVGFAGQARPRHATHNP